VSSTSRVGFITNSAVKGTRDTNGGKKATEKMFFLLLYTILTEKGEKTKDKEDNENTG